MVSLNGLFAGTLSPGDPAGSGGSAAASGATTAHGAASSPRASETPRVGPDGASATTAAGTDNSEPVHYSQGFVLMCDALTVRLAPLDARHISRRVVIVSRRQHPCVNCVVTIDTTTTDVTVVIRWSSIARSCGSSRTRCTRE